MVNNGIQGAIQKRQAELREGTCVTQERVLREYLKDQNSTRNYKSRIS